MKTHARKPLYKISELAEIIGIKNTTLHGRINNCTEPPDQAIALKATEIPHGTKSVLCQVSTMSAKSARYYKDEFLRWHEKNWGHLNAAKQTGPAA